MPIESVPNADLAYCLIAFDDQGNERRGDPDSSAGLLSQRLLDDLRRESITDVFILSHGWKADIPAAREQYGRWIQAMASCKNDRTRMRALRQDFKPLIVGLHWPSLPWGDEEFRLISRDFELDATSNATDAGIDLWVESYARRVANTNKARAALKTIFWAALDNVAPVHLPADVRAAYVTLNAEARLGNDGPSGAPGSDRETFDPECGYQIARMAEQSSFGGSIPIGLLAPLLQLSFWKMKDRARAFGESGAFELLFGIKQAKPTVRIHVIGHSFGCIVASAMICGPGGRTEQSRVDSLALLQGALSLWSYCSNIPVAQGKPGHFHAIIASHCVRGSIITTQSEYDTAVRVFYPAGAGVAHQVTYAPGELPRYGAVGAFGLQGLEKDVVNMYMLPADGDYDFRPGLVYNLESSAYIREGRGVSGAHSDIAKSEVAHAIWELARQCPL